MSMELALCCALVAVVILACSAQIAFSVRQRYRKRLEATLDEFFRLALEIANDEGTSTATLDLVRFLNQTIDHKRVFLGWARAIASPGSDVSPCLDSPTVRKKFTTLVRFAVYASSYQHPVIGKLLRVEFEKRLRGKPERAIRAAARIERNSGPLTTAC